MRGLYRSWIPSCLLAALATCGGGGGGNNGDDDDDDGGGDPFPDATPAPYCTAKSGSNLRLQLITDGVNEPVALAAPPADDRLFIAERGNGRIRVVDDGVLQQDAFLTLPVNSAGDEQGLLGLAFHPGYAKNGRFFVFYTRGDQSLRISEFGADPTSNTARTDEKEILTIPHAQRDNHNGGTLTFGPDGYLYISVGDGGSANNDHRNGQNPDTRLAKVLRIDVDRGDPYAVPADNPWAKGGGVPEMFAWGLRNPWKIAIDPANGDVWIGDVGQGRYEDVDVVRGGDLSGPNFGWAVFEGTECFADDPDGSAGCDDAASYRAPVVPIYRVDNGHCAVIMGGVYRGTCMPDMVGRVFFGDRCAGTVYSIDRAQSSTTLGAATDHTADLDPGSNLIYGELSSFGYDGYNELYALSLGGDAVYRIEVE